MRTELPTNRMRKLAIAIRTKPWNPSPVCSPRASATMVLPVPCSWIWGWSSRLLVTSGDAEGVTESDADGEAFTADLDGLAGTGRGDGDRDSDGDGAARGTGAAAGAAGCGARPAQVSTRSKWIRVNSLSSLPSTTAVAPMSLAPRSEKTKASVCPAKEVMVWVPPGSKVTDIEMSETLRGTMKCHPS
jgi:hypothetical protein